MLLFLHRHRVLLSQSLLWPVVIMDQNMRTEGSWRVTYFLVISVSHCLERRRIITRRSAAQPVSGNTSSRYLTLVSKSKREEAQLSLQ